MVECLYGSVKSLKMPSKPVCNCAHTVSADTYKLFILVFYTGTFISSSQVVVSVDIMCSFLVFVQWICASRMNNSPAD